MDYAKNYGLKKHIYENKKSGILTHNEMDSALVGLSVLSSNFFSKLLSISL
jgi:hypothetical protein